MEWNHKNIIIRVESDGKFYFTLNEDIKVCSSLDTAKNIIDEALKEYYNFNKKDISNLCKKLNRREKEFVLNLIRELEIHRNSTYCEIGWSEDFLFSIEN